MKSKPNPARLDAWDFRILSEIQSDGRISKSELAKRVHLSASACSERLRALEVAGIIEGFYARLSPVLISGMVFVMVEVVLERHRLEDQRHFETAIGEFPEILDCWAVGGRIDYLMRVASPSMAAYQDFMEGLLQAGLGIDQYYSLVVTKPVKSNSPIPLVRTKATVKAEALVSTAFDPDSANSSAKDVDSRETGEAFAVC